MELYAQAYQQLASISAVLGGLAFTAAASLLAAGIGNREQSAFSRSANVTVAMAVLSAVSLIVAGLMWSFMAADINRAIAQGENSYVHDLTRLNWIPSLALLAGAGLFFASIGASGWIVSRKLGTLTSVLGLVGGIVLLVMVYIFGRVGE